MDTQRLASKLAERGLGSLEEMQRALDDPAYQDRTPAEALVAAGIPEDEIYQALSEELAIPLVQIEPQNLDRGLVGLIPREVAEQHAVLPLTVEGQRLTLAMADPLDVVAEDVVRFATHLSVKRVLACRSQIMAGLAAVYADSGSVDSILERIPATDLELAGEGQEDARALDQAAKSQPMIALVNTLLSDAIKIGASDIHVEPTGGRLRVRYRVDGVLRTIVELPRRVQDACLSRLKLMARIDIAERRIPQDGRFRVSLRGRDVDLRVNTLPGTEGEKIVLRLLERSKAQLSLADLGFSGVDQERVRQVLDSAQGMILITGPTGSGKTTTLYAFLGKLNCEADNLITVEDPVEYELPGVHQVAINPKAGMTFSLALRAILRQDPDVVMVGEIRDPETAEIALQAAQTGHLVLSTLHTNDAASSVTRLLHMGVPAYLVGSSLICVMAQRLVRRLCHYCRCSKEPDPRTLVVLDTMVGAARPERDWSAPGCEECGFTGFKGRIGLYEVLLITDRMRNLILQNAPARVLTKAAREEGMRLLVEDGLLRVSQGDTSLEEVMRVVQVEQQGLRTCLSCERPLQEDFRVCPYCSQGLSRFCPFCHKGVREDWRTCPYCLGQLGEPPEPPQVNLPAPSRASPPPRPPSHPPAAAREEVGKGEEVLVMEPDPAQRRILRSLLERGGYQPQLASDPEQGLEWAITRHPRVILVDLGWARAGALERLRSQLATSIIPLLLLTRRGPEGVEGLELQADDYLLKPADSRTLLGKVSRLVERAR